MIVKHISGFTLLLPATLTLFVIGDHARVQRVPDSPHLCPHTTMNAVSPNNEVSLVITSIMCVHQYTVVFLVVNADDSAVHVYVRLFGEGLIQNLE